MRATLVDTLATVTFFTIVAAATEFFVAGLSAQQVLVSRVTTIPVLFATGRAYGLWRDGLVARLDARRRGAVAMLGTDTLAFLSFQVPVYAAILVLAGATGAQMTRALVAATLAMLLLSRPFGMFLDWLRGYAGAASRMPLPGSDDMDPSQFAPTSPLNAPDTSVLSLTPPKMRAPMCATDMEKAP